MTDIQRLINQNTGVNINPGIMRSTSRSLARGMVDRLRAANPGARNIGATFD